MSIDQQLVREIVERIRRVAQPDRIILFGSAAGGSLGPDSDIDLLVLEAEPGDLRRESIRIREVLRGMGFPFDVVVMATERFEETRNLIGGLAYPAAKHGKIIYEAA